jgi:hypothetical protein
MEKPEWGFVDNAAREGAHTQCSPALGVARARGIAVVR